MRSSFEELLALRLVNGLFSAVSWTAGLAWLVASVPGTYRGRTLAIVNATATAASLVGPLIGGPLVSAVRPEADHARRSAAPPAARHLGAVRAEPRRPHGDRAHVGVTALRIGVREPGLLHAFAGIAFAASAMGVQQVLAPIHLSDLGLSSAGIGWIWTAGAAVSLCRRRLRRPPARPDRQAGQRAHRRADRAPCWLLPRARPRHVPYALGVIAMLGFGTLIWTTVYPLCSEAAERAGIGQGVAMGALNSVWALASVVAPIWPASWPSWTSPRSAIWRSPSSASLPLGAAPTRALAPSPGTAVDSPVMTSFHELPDGAKLAYDDKGSGRDCC